MPRLNIQVLFSVLNHHDVAYVLVGALGAIAYGARLRTADMDICNATDADNLQRVAAALRKLGAHLVHAPVRGMTSIDLNDWTTLRLDDPTEHHLFSTPFGAIDVLPEPLGASGWGTKTNYPELNARAITMTVFGLSVRVAPFIDIAASKLAAGRRQDIAAAGELRRVGALLARGEQPAYGLEQFAAEMQGNRSDE